MPQAVDSTPRVRHGNPVTEAGFTMIPNVVMLRHDLTPTAKLVYGYLKHLAWRNGSDTSSEPARDVIASDLGLSAKTVTAATNELTGVGLVEVTRRGQGRTNLYIVNDPTDSRKGESTLPENQDVPIPTRARSLLGKTEEITSVGANAPTPSGPPPLHKIDGQNLAFNTLRDLCGIRPNDRNRTGEVVAALNGGRGVRAGIRELVWGELVETTFGGDEAKAREVVDAVPESFENAMVDVIQRRGEQYRRAMNGATLTPTALAKWWLSLEGMAEAGRGGLTAAEMAAFPDA